MFFYHILGERIAGSAPILVTRADGAIHVSGTSERVETCLDRFERFGNPDGRTQATVVKLGVAATIIAAAGRLAAAMPHRVSER